jgi:hypothetical protein
MAILLSFMTSTAEGARDALVATRLAGDGRRIRDFWGGPVRGFAA